MSYLSPPPQNIPLTINGRITPQWLAFFQSLMSAASEVAGIISGTTPIVTANPYSVKTGSATLTSSDFGKVIIFNTGSSDVICNLMSFASTELYNWIRIVRLGTGRLTIIPTSTMRIENGSLGGRFWCDEERRKAANVTLQAVSLTQLAITGGTGRWKVV